MFEALGLLHFWPMLFKIPIALDTTLVVKGNLLEIPPLCYGFSSWDLFENLTLFIWLRMNLCEYPLFNRLILCLSLNSKNLSNLELVLTNRFISQIMTPLLGGKMFHVCRPVYWWVLYRLRHLILFRQKIWPLVYLEI